MVYLVVCRSTLGGWTTEHAIVVFNHDYTTYTQTIQNNNNNLCITKLVKQWALCRWNCMMFESKIIIISNNCRLVFLMSPYWHNTSAEQTLIAFWNPFLSLSLSLNLIHLLQFSLNLDRKLVENMCSNGKTHKIEWHSAQSNGKWRK